jgi:hypothetical protein
LTGEVLQQLDLFVCERSHLLAIDGNRADNLALFEHRYRNMHLHVQLQAGQITFHADGRRGKPSTIPCLLNHFGARSILSRLLGRIVEQPKSLQCIGKHHRVRRQRQHMH